MHILRKTFFSKEQQKNFKFFLRRNIECTPFSYSLHGKSILKPELHIFSTEMPDKANSTGFFTFLFSLFP